MDITSCEATPTRCGGAIEMDCVVSAPASGQYGPQGEGPFLHDLA